jgi:hypothetical protein
MAPKPARLLRPQRTLVAPPRQMGAPSAAAVLFDLPNRATYPGQATTAGTAKPVATYAFGFEASAQNLAQNVVSRRTRSS